MSIKQYIIEVTATAETVFQTEIYAESLEEAERVAQHYVMTGEYTSEMDQINQFFDVESEVYLDEQDRSLEQTPVEDLINVNDGEEEVVEASDEDSEEEDSEDELSDVPF